MFVQLACAFRYGSDDLDVMGLCFRKDIWINHHQLHPENHKPALSPMHETLMKKAGDGAVPFSFDVGATCRISTPMMQLLLLMKLTSGQIFESY